MDFFFQLNLLPPLLASLAGGKIKNNNGKLKFLWLLLAIKSFQNQISFSETKVSKYFDKRNKKWITNDKAIIRKHLMNESVQLGLYSKLFHSSWHSFFEYNAFRMELDWFSGLIILLLSPLLAAGLGQSVRNNFWRRSKIFSLSLLTRHVIVNQMIIDLLALI